MEVAWINHKNFLNFHSLSGIDVTYGMPVDSELRDYVSPFGASFLNSSIDHIEFNTYNGYKYLTFSRNGNLVPIRLYLSGVDNLYTTQLKIRFLNTAASDSIIDYDIENSVFTISKNYSFNSRNVINSISLQQGTKAWILELNYLPGTDFGFASFLNSLFRNNEIWAFSGYLRQSNIRASYINPTSTLNVTHFLSSPVAQYNIPCYAIKDYLAQVVGRTDIRLSSVSSGYQIKRTTGINYGDFAGYDVPNWNAVSHKPILLFNNYGSRLDGTKTISSQHPLNIQVNETSIVVNGTTYTLGPNDHIIWYYRLPGTLAHTGGWCIKTGEVGSDYLGGGFWIASTPGENLIADFNITPTAITLGEMSRAIGTYTINSNTNVLSQYPYLSEITNTNLKNLYRQLIKRIQPNPVINTVTLTPDWQDGGGGGDVYFQNKYLPASTSPTKENFNKSGVTCNGRQLRLATPIEYIPNNNDTNTFIYVDGAWAYDTTVAWNHWIFSRWFNAQTAAYHTQFITSVGVVPAGSYSDYYYEIYYTQTSAEYRIKEVTPAEVDIHISEPLHDVYYDFTGWADWSKYVRSGAWESQLVISMRTNINYLNGWEDCDTPYPQNVDLNQPALAIVLWQANY